VNRVCLGGRLGVSGGMVYLEDLPLSEGFGHRPANKVSATIRTRGLRAHWCIEMTILIDVLGDGGAV
jgi:hypothetical protein